MNGSPPSRVVQIILPGTGLYILMLCKLYKRVDAQVFRTVYYDIPTVALPLETLGGPDQGMRSLQGGAL